MVRIHVIWFLCYETKCSPECNWIVKYTHSVEYFPPNLLFPIYSGVRVIATRILHEISLLMGELAIRGTKLTLNAGLGTENKLLIVQYYCY